jgi:hypothetical protein
VAVASSDGGQRGKARVLYDQIMADLNGVFIPGGNWVVGDNPSLRVVFEWYAAQIRDML